MSQYQKYRAKYDANGDIVLESLEGVVPLQENVIEVIPEAEKFFEEPMGEIPTELQHIPSEIQHVHFPRAFVALHAFKQGTGRVRIAADSLHFVGTFVAVFLVLFISLNFGSYYQVIRATLLPGADQHEKHALTLMANPLLKKKLLAVPELPRAGKEVEVLSMIPAVAPPDNRLIIPKIRKNIPIVEVADNALRRGDYDMFDEDIQNALKFGVVHYPGTAKPGEIGNVFLTGHSSNYPWIESSYNAVFALLPTLDLGDEYSVFYNGELHRYRITEKFEVSPKDVSVLAQPKDERTSTLMTCVPVGTTLKRLIIRAQEVDQAAVALL